MNNYELELLESKYLEKYYHFLMYCLDEILIGFETKNKIKDDWIDQWEKDLLDGAEKGISDFAVGAERIIYALLNGKGIGQPNSSPVGSDLFFEVEDAFIHIDLKTVQIRNLGDYTGKIFVGNNQNSYKTIVNVSGEDRIYEEASLPQFYTVKENEFVYKKPCLTYFITILYNAETLDIININLLSMPNGQLESIYGNDIIQAGKVRFPATDPRRNTHCKSIRYKWKNCRSFTLLENKERYKSIYFNQQIVNHLYQEHTLSLKEKEILINLFGKDI